MKRPWTSGWVSSVALIAAVGVRWLLDPLMGDTFPLVTLFAAVAAATWSGGYRAAIPVAVLGYLACDYLYIPPRGSFGWDHIQNVVGLIAYLLTCSVIIGFGEALRIAQNRFAEQGERLRTTLASIGDGVITTDLEGRVTHLNKVAEEMTGWPSAGAIGQPLEAVFRIVNETSGRPVENPAVRALRDGVIVGLANHTVLLSKDGSERSIDDSASPIRCKEGELVGCVLIFRDITDRRQAERALVESEARKTAILDTALDCIVTIDHAGRILEFNPAAERTFGRSRKDVLGRELADLIVPPAFREPHRAGLARYLATGDGPILNQRLELTALRADGTEFPVELAVTRIAGDERPAFTAYLRDISQRKEIEGQLRASEARYRAIGEAIDFGVWMCDAQGRNTYASESFLRMVGINQQQCSDFGWGDVLHPRDAADTIAAWKECVLAGGVWDREHRFRGVDGQWHDVLARGVPVKNEQGEVLGWAGINLDIARLKRAEEQLKEADRRKDEFLATLAHELRNPLAPVRNAVQILHMQCPDNPELHWARDVIDRQMQAMTRLIDDLMDLSRISRNKLDLRKERVALATVVQGAVETSRPWIVEQAHELTVTLPPEPIFLEADPTRLTQVFLNLLNNAAKYTERGGSIRLNAERQGSDVLVRVQDKGIGIPAANLPNLFQMFSQVEEALSRSQGGLGIGLALVKRLVELHGGSIEVRSEGAGKGSEFEVRLPILVNDPPAPSVSSETDRRPLKSQFRVLVVDDNKDAASSLSMLLKVMGNKIRLAHDGEEAVRAASEFHPHVVLLDIGLPKLNGYEACQQIRALPDGKDMTLIAVTGWGQEDDRQRAVEAGFDRHLVKPVEPKVLMEILAGLPARTGA